MTGSDVTGQEPTPSSAATLPPAVGALAWLWILVPFAYGVWELLIKVVPLFSH